VGAPTVLLITKESNEEFEQKIAEELLVARKCGLIATKPQALSAVPPHVAENLA
jgi:hypothetical protein